MQVEIVGDPGPQRTEAPREMTADEVAAVRQAGRLAGVKLHIAWTDSTLGAAVRCVDAVLAH